MSERSADELALACAEAMYERDRASQALGIRIVEVKAGFASLKMDIRADMLNGHAICHGGFIFTLADTAFAYACNSRNEVALAQTCDIDFIQAAREHDQLQAVAEERSRRGRSGLYDVKISKDDGELIAHFRGRCRQVQGEVIRNTGSA